MAVSARAKRLASRVYDGSAIAVMALVFSYLLASLGVTDWITGAVTGLALGFAFMATSTLVIPVLRMMWQSFSRRRG